jgi:hypothetical protein
MKRYLILTILTISGCTSANKLLEKAYKKDIITTATFLRERFPCKTISNDTIIKLDTSYFEVQCDPIHDSLYHTDTVFIQSKPRTYEIKNRKFFAVPNKQTIITKIVADTACDVLYRESQRKADKLTTDYISAQNWIKWLLVILIASILLNILLLRK